VISRRLMIAACLAASAVFAIPSARGDEAPAKDGAAKKNARILMLTQSAGFRHGSVTRKDGQLSPAERAMTDLAVSSNLFRVDCTQDASKITKEQLDDYDIVMFYTTLDLPFADDVRDYLFNVWVKKKGHGFIGAHSAADTFHNYEPYWEMLGGTFEIQDEIYQFKHWQPEKVHVLMSLNMAKTRLKKPYQVPIAWVKNYGDGKVLHMSLGHREEVWTNPKYLESMLGGIKWIMGQEPGDATPNPDVSSAQEAKAKADFEAAEKGS
jgi:type 1 glutamine amidotransferase